MAPTVASAEMVALVEQQVAAAKPGLPGTVVPAVPAVPVVTPAMAVPAGPALKPRTVAPAAPAVSRGSQDLVARAA